ncbi:MAG: cytochrome c biogenesis protein ResB, partial [Clostridia bacterium]|nr:cytochrome c biogenesis protein ResB [Clostridia bacterium]
MKKIRDLLSSMSFAIALLVLLAVCCAFGSFITQGQTYEWYAGVYGERAAVLIIALYLDDVYHSWWFFALAGFLCLDLLLCDLTKLPSLIRRTKNACSPQSVLRSPVTASLSDITDPAPVFSALHMPAPKAFGQEGASGLYSVKNRSGLWGAWVCHLGILLLILGFSLGQITHVEYTVYGVPGDEKPIGDTGYTLSIDDFRIDRRDDGTAQQYTASITVSGDDIPAQSAEASVNHPAALHGYKIYQNSTGWAAAVTVSKGGEALQEMVLCAGEYMSVQAIPELSVFFNAFYPNYAP